MNTKTVIATLKLFNAIQVSEKASSFNRDVLARSMKNGYILDPSIRPSVNLFKVVDEVIGVSGEKLNASFHKSWGKVATASDYQLWAEQILHYITTYGFESLGIYEEGLVYIPDEVLNIPDFSGDLKFVFVRGLTAEEILFEIVKLSSSGVALSQETLDNIMLIVKDNQYDYEFITDVKNRELYTLLCEFYGIVPSEPVQYLRYVISKLTGESLLIKNEKLISMIKESDYRQLDKLLLSAPENLASIFFRFKPLFLAMKSISRNKTFFNQLRKKANYQHVPLDVDYLNDVTNQIKTGDLNFRELRNALKNYSVWRKIRLANALNNRLTNNGSIVYKVRNGKGWVSDFEWNIWNGILKMTSRALEYTLESISNDIRSNVEGKTFLIPENIHYAIPATEKQFVGNIPSGSYVSIESDAIVGVHWYNSENERIDIDFSLLDVSGKFGWDRLYRNSDRSVLFSGDVTDAPRPFGASELFYLRYGVESPKLIMANYFNYRKTTPVDCQFFVASEDVSNRLDKNYMVNPSNILLSQTINFDVAQKTIGLVADVEGETRVYFSTSDIGKSITSRNNEMSMKTLDFYMNTLYNVIELKDVLEMAGARVVNQIPDEEEYVDLSPSTLDKNSILGLFAEN